MNQFKEKGYNLKPYPYKINRLSNHIYHIEYTSPTTHGVMDIDCSYYENNLKKISKLFENCSILVFEQRSKNND